MFRSVRIAFLWWFNKDPTGCWITGAAALDYLIFQYKILSFICVFSIATTQNEEHHFWFWNLAASLPFCFLYLRYSTSPPPSLISKMDLQHWHFPILRLQTSRKICKINYFYYCAPSAGSKKRENSKFIWPRPLSSLIYTGASQSSGLDQHSEALSHLYSAILYFIESSAWVFSTLLLIPEQRDFFF